MLDKIYIRGEIGWGSRIRKELISRGGIDANNLGCCNPFGVYYINSDNIISFLPDDIQPEDFFSSDWVEYIIDRKKRKAS